MQRQRQISEWVRHVVVNPYDIKGRALRVVEEVTELAQACGVSSRTVHRVVDYVFSRPAGDPKQEIAGVMSTCYAAAEAIGCDADHELDVELMRIHQPEIMEKIRLRDLAKNHDLEKRVQFNCYCDRCVSQEGEANG